MKSRPLEVAMPEVKVRCPVFELSAAPEGVPSAGTWDPSAAELEQIAVVRRRRAKKLLGCMFPLMMLVSVVVGGLFPPALLVSLPVALVFAIWGGRVLFTPRKVSYADDPQALFLNFFSGVTGTGDRGSSSLVAWDEVDVSYCLLTPAARRQTGGLEQLRQHWASFWASVPGVEGREASAQVKETKTQPLGEVATGTSLVAISSHTLEGNVTTHYAPVVILFQAAAVRHDGHWYLTGGLAAPTARTADVTFEQS